MATEERRDHDLKALLVAFAAVNAAIGLWMLFGAGSFQEFTNFGARNDHQVRDFSTAYLSMAVGLALAVRRSAWRVPVLVITLVQYALHLVVHIVDVNKAHPPAAGWGTVGGLALPVLVLAYLLRRASADTLPADR